MRILQLIGQTRVGGAESFGYTLSAELARRGHEVLLLANRANGPLFERERPAGLSVEALSRRSRRDPRIVSFLLGAIRRFEPEIIHAHNFEANTWARALGMVFPRIRIICHEHSSLKVNQPIHRIMLDRLLYARCSAVIVVNRSLYDLLRRRHRVSPEKLKEIPNGIDVDRFASVGSMSGEPAPGHARDPHGVVCVASLIEVKNHRLLLQAWSEVIRSQPAAHLTLVGDGPLRPELEQQAQRTGISKSVEFAGAAVDVRPYLWRASIFVLASLLEALPISLLEARAAGLACVASGVGGIPEAMGDESMGCVVPPRDPAALAGVLKDLLASPVRCAEMGAWARRDVALRYSMAACADRIVEIYHGCCPRG